jgi:hypothetical protein
MAFEVKKDEEEEKGQGTSQAPALLGTQQVQPTSEQATQGSGSFTNLDKYVEANKPKTKEFSDKIVSNISGEVGKFGSQLDQRRQQELGSQSAIGQEEGRLGKGTNFVANTIQSAGSKGISDEDMAKFQQYRTGYNPNIKQATFANELTSAEDLQKRGERFSTPQGRQEELYREFAKKSPGYSAGQRSLDQLLLGKDKEVARQANRDVRAATSGLGDRVEGLRSDITGKLDAQQARRKSIQDMARARIFEGSDSSKLDPNLNQRGFQEIERDLEGKRQASIKDIEGQRQQFLDYANREGRQMFGLQDEAAGYMNHMPDVTLGSVANQQEVQRYNALRKLAGLSEKPFYNVGQGAGPETQYSAIEKERLGREAAFKEATKSDLNDIRNMRQLLTSPGLERGSKDVYTYQRDVANQLRKLGVGPDLVGGLTSGLDDIYELKRRIQNQQIAPRIDRIKAAAEKHRAGTLGFEGNALDDPYIQAYMNKNRIPGT